MVCLVPIQQINQITHKSSALGNPYGVIMGYGHLQRVCLSHYWSSTIQYDPWASGWALIQWNWIEERKHDMVILESMFVTHYWPTMYMVLSHTVENCVVKYGRIIMGYGHSHRVCLSHYSLDTITYNPTVLCIFLKSSTWPTSPNTFIAPYQCLAASRCDQLTITLH